MPILPLVVEHGPLLIIVSLWEVHGFSGNPVSFLYSTPRQLMCLSSGAIGDTLIAISLGYFLRKQRTTWSR